MLICHFSDNHSGTQLLPKADLYICTGDFYPNAPLLKFRKYDRKTGQEREIWWDPNGPSLDPTIPYYRRPDGDLIARKIEAKREEHLQKLWIQKIGGYRQFLASPDAPVVCVRGNHDFTDLAPAFGGDVWEVDNDPTRTITIGGLKIGGFRGIPYINGEWSDEKQKMKVADWGEDDLTPRKLPGDVDRSDVKGLDDLESIIGLVPKDIDILISHCPPRGLLDSYGHSYGSEALASHINQRCYIGPKPLKAVCFGHIHESKGLVSDGVTIFSNSATTHHVFEV